MPTPKPLNEVFKPVHVPNSFIKILMNNLDVYPDFPKEGVNFIDVFPVFRSKYLLSRLTSALKRSVEEVKPLDSITAVAAPESRGFCFGVLVAQALGVPFIPFRKAGKLPCDVVATSYDLEYGSATLEFPKGVLTEHDNVLIVDDLLAVGGTMKAMIDTIHLHTEATIHSGVTLLNLADLPKPEFNVPVVSVLHLKEI